MPPLEASAPGVSEILLDQWPFRHLASCLILSDLPAGGLVTVCSVAQENDAEHRHEIFAGGQLGIRPELVGGFPQAVFKLFNVLELVVIYEKISREGICLWE